MCLEFYFFSSLKLWDCICFSFTEVPYVLIHPPFILDISVIVFDFILSLFLQVLFFSTMTRLLDVMEEYLTLKQYRYLRLDGHTSGSDRGALIDMFNQPGSPYFLFLLR